MGCRFYCEKVGGWPLNRSELSGEKEPVQSRILSEIYPLDALTKISQIFFRNECINNAAHCARLEDCS